MHFCFPAGNISVDADGVIDAGGRGYGPGHGPGAGMADAFNIGGSGGSHGGAGGRGSKTSHSGLAYDNVLQPMAFGSGGAGPVSAQNVYHLAEQMG